MSASRPNARGPARGGRDLAVLALVATLAIVAGASLNRAFQLHVLWVPLVGSALLAPAISGALAWKKGPRALPVHVAMSAVAWAGFTLATVARTPQALWGGVIHGWALVLSSAVPVAATPEQLVVVTASVWPCAFMAAELALRSTSPLLPVLPLLVLATGTRMLAATGPFVDPLVVAGAFVALATLLALTRRGPAVGGPPAVRDTAPSGSSRRRSAEPGSITVPVRTVPAGHTGASMTHRLGWVLAGTALAASLAATSPALASALPITGARQPFDPRSFRHDASSTCQQLDPLAEIQARQLHPGVPLLDVTTTVPRSTTAPAEMDLSLAVLNRFDGAEWEPTGTFESTGPVLSPLPGPRLASEPVQLRVTVLGLTGCALPAPTGVRTLDGGQFAIDPTTGQLADPEGLHRGQRYALRADLTTYAGMAGRLEAAAVQRGPGVAVDTALPAGFPRSMRQLAKQVTEDALSPFGQAAALQQYFQKEGGFSQSAQAPAGHSLAQLSAFLSTRGRVGTSEQFATSFALLARAVGLPTRVVEGVKLTPKQGTSTVRVTNGDVQAWPEVDLSGIGWVPFDPTPARTAGGASGAGPQRSAAQPAPGSPSQVAQQVASSPKPAPATSPGHTQKPVTLRVRRPGRGPVSWVVLGLIAAAVLLVVLEVAVVAEKRRRRLVRRRQRNPDRRILGAWMEATDRLFERGLPLATPRTAAEVVRQAELVVGPSVAAPLAELAQAVNAALYRPTPPGRADADRAWRSVDAMVAELARDARLGFRARALLDPRSLMSDARRERLGGRLAGRSLRVANP